MTNDFILLKMIVKICGMGDKERMHQLATMPIDMLGFIFYSKSPRYVIGKIDPDEIAKLPEHIQKVGVFVNTSKEQILELANIYHLTTFQLHGIETSELCSELKSEGFNIIKAFNLNYENDYKAYAPYCEYFLFDTPSEQHGGTGQKFDWGLLKNYTGSTPFLLSGGIGPEDIEAIKKIDHPQFIGIDINSKFEIEPGVKDIPLLEAFFEALKGRKISAQGNVALS
jgi:phosphoribosylanthranilate isomerase